MAVAVHRKTKAKKQVHIKFTQKLQAVRAVPTTVKPGAVAELRNRLQLTQAVFARLLPVSVRSLATLESGSPPTEVVARRLIELRRLTNALSEVIKKEALGKWLQTPNDALGGLKPLEVIDRGECDRIWSMIYFLRSGVPS
jgi:DNA-binding transcriptional regulator YiaG